MVTYKTGSSKPHVSYDDIADEAIAHGWVDSQPRKLDAERSQLHVTPRKPKSTWSRVNKQRVSRLEDAGLMTEAGRAAVALAKDSGAWSALDDVENLVEPVGLRTQLDANADARRYSDAFPRSTKRAILEWIGTAKTDATRDKRIDETARLAASDIRANQPRQPNAPHGRSPPRPGWLCRYVEADCSS